MARYSIEFKEQIVRKMMPPSNQRVARISRETGIAAPTLYSWRNQFRTQGHVVPASDTNPEGLEKPLCWKNRAVRNWSRIESVWLNPPKEHRSASNMKLAA